MDEFAYAPFARATHSAENDSAGMAHLITPVDDDADMT
jgi:hypothetical protein